LFDKDSAMNGLIAKVRRFLVSGNGPTARYVLKLAPIIAACVTIGALSGSCWA
jgi:hypothetical protein